LIVRGRRRSASLDQIKGRGGWTLRPCRPGCACGPCRSLWPREPLRPGRACGPCRPLWPREPYWSYRSLRPGRPGCACVPGRPLRPWWPLGSLRPWWSRRGRESDKEFHGMAGFFVFQRLCTLQRKADGRISRKTGRRYPYSGGLSRI
jgi:hypothetical protein